MATLKLTQRYSAWLELMALSEALSISASRAQGHSLKQAREIWRRRWTKAAKERERVSRRIASHLNAKDRAARSAAA